VESDRLLQCVEQTGSTTDRFIASSPETTPETTGPPKKVTTVNRLVQNRESMEPAPHPRRITWRGASALALGGSNQSIFLIGALLASQGTAAISLLAVGLVLAYMATPGWIELSCMFPNRVGGIAATCAEAFRPYNAVLANLTGVCYWWGWIPTCGLTAIFSADAIHQWYLPAVPVKLLATVLVLIFTGVNICGLKWAVRLAVPIACFAGLLALGTSLIPIVAGSVDWHRAASFRLIRPFGGFSGGLTSAMAGLYLVGFAAPAFEAAACHVGEMRNPARDQPRAMWVSGAVASLYFVVMPVVWLGVFGSSALQGNLASLLGPSFAPLLGSFAKAAAIWFIAFNMFSGTIQPLSGTSRTLSQLSEDGLLPRILGYRHPRTDAPVVAIAVTAVFSIAFLLAGDPTSVIAATNLTYLIGISLPSVAVWILRRDDPDRERSYRAHDWSIRLGLLAAATWLVATIFGFEQFGLPIVIFGMVLAYSGSLAYSWRVHFDRRHAGVRGPRRSIHFKLTGALLAVLGLDGLGYFIAVSNVRSGDLSLIALLKDLFVTVGLLTIAVGLVLPGTIAHTANQVATAATHMSDGVLNDLTEAIEAFSAGELERADFAFTTQRVEIRSRDEFAEMGRSFNAMQDSVMKVSAALSVAVAQATRQKDELERIVEERTSELSAAYERLKYSQEQRYEILERLKIYTDVMGEHSLVAPDIQAMGATIASALGPVMRADVVMIQLTDGDGELEASAITWQRDVVAPGDGMLATTPVREEFLEVLAPIISAGVTRAFHETTGTVRSFLTGAESTTDPGFDLIVCPFFTNERDLIGVITLGRDGASQRWGDTSIVEFVAADLGRSLMSARLIHDQQQLVHQLQALDRTKDEMLSTFSHELRTPLASIVAYAELLREDPGMNAQDTKMLGIIEKNAHRLSDLVEDILTLSHFSSDIMASDLAPALLDPIIKSVTDALAPSVAQHELTLSFVPGAPEGVFFADVAQIERLAFNLLTNAIKFTPPGGTIRVTTWLERDDVVLSVSDTGMGIEADEINQVFERFFRGSNVVANAVPGTGLGLAIVDVIVRHHGGRVAATANEPQGTIFTVHLPRADVRAGEFVTNSTGRS